MQLIFRILTCVCALLLSMQSMAEKQFYAGGGATLDQVSTPFVKEESNYAPGMAAFVGYNFKQQAIGIVPKLELGYSKTEDFHKDRKGDYEIEGFLFAAGIQKYLPEIDPNLYVLAKAGVDLGDDSGLFQGFAVGYKLIPEVGVQFEYRNKNASISNQIQVLIEF